MKPIFTATVFLLFTNLLIAQINVNPCAQDIQLFPSSYCYPDSIQFFSYPVPDSAKTVIYKVDSDTISTFDSLGILSPGIHDLIVIVQTDTCWYSDTTRVQIIDPPTPSIFENYITNTEVKFISGGPYDSFFWKVNNIIISLDSTMTFTFQNDSTYQVCLGVYQNNCYTDTCYFKGFGSSVSVTETEQNDLILYPNPTTDRLYIRNENLSINQLEIIDISGPVVYRDVTPNGQNIELQLGHLSKGIYLVRINNEIFRRIVLQ
jgi:hypothetical protein